MLLLLLLRLVLLREMSLEMLFVVVAFHFPLARKRVDRVYIGSLLFLNTQSERKMSCCRSVRRVHTRARPQTHKHTEKLLETKHKTPTFNDQLNVLFYACIVIYTIWLGMDMLYIAKCFVEKQIIGFSFRPLGAYCAMFASPPLRTIRNGVIT